MEARKKEDREKEKGISLTFLKLTREGKYAKIDEGSLSYSRFKILRERPRRDEYYYSVR